MSMQPFHSSSLTSAQPPAQALSAGNSARPARLQGSASDVPASPAAKPSMAELQQVLADVQEVIRPVAQDLLFSIDKDSGRTVVKIVDSSTDEVIRQIPSEELLSIARALDRFQGLLLKQEA